MKASLRTLAQAALLLASGSLALAQQPTAQERVVALKASLAAKAKNLTVTVQNSGYGKATQ